MARFSQPFGNGKSRRQRARPEPGAGDQPAPPAQPTARAE